MLFRPRYLLELLRWTSPGRRNLLAAVVLTCAVAITSALFAIVDGLWLRPLPFVQPERLVRVSVGTEWNRRPTADQNAAMREALASDPRIAASARISEGPLSERYGYEVGEGGLYNYRVTPSFFRLLGVAPARGRVFVESDAAHADIVPAVIAHSIWQSRWGGDPDVVGRVVSLGETRVEIVGVMPAGFTFPAGTTLWTPLAASGPVIPSIARLAGPDSRSELAQAYPLLDFVPMGEYYRPQQHEAVTFIVVGSAVLFLTVVLNLLSLRAVDLSRRIRDAAIRRSLGATPAQLAFETAARVGVLAAVALAIGWLAVPPLMQLALAQLPPALFRHAEAIWTWRTVAGSAALALAGALAFHWPASPVRFHGSVAHQGIVRQGLPSHALAIACLVAAGAALAYVAALATVSAASLERVELGFEPANVLDVSFPRRLPGDDDGRETAFQRSLDVRDLPGVVSTALASGRPLRPSFLAGTARVVGNPACEPTTVRVNYVTPGYFRTIGVRMRDGEAFGSPVAGAPGVESSTPAAGFGAQTVVNEALMRVWRACGAALGTRIQVISFVGTIVAIAGDTIDRDPREPPEPQVYFPGSPDSGNMLLVKHGAGAQGDDRLLRQALARMFPGADVTPLSADVARARRADRGRALALQLFCGLSILLAALGLLANQTAMLDNRRREMALRLALGADVPHLRRRVIIPAAAGAAVGAPAGVAIGIACGRLGEALFFGVSAVHVPALVSIPVAAAAIAVSVALYGARAVSRLSPSSILNEAP